MHSSDPLAPATAPETTDDGHHAARASRPLEITFAAVATAFSVCYLTLTANITLRHAAAAGQMDAKLWPTIIGVTAVAVSVLLLVFAITRPPQGREDIEQHGPHGVLRVTATLVITLGYVALWGVGNVIAFGYRIQLYPIITALYMLIMMLVYGHRRIISLIVYPVCLTAFVYVVFGMLLRIPL